MFSKEVISLLLTLSVMSYACKTVCLQRYLPVAKDKMIIFNKEIDSTKRSSIDTLICRQFPAKLIFRPDHFLRVMDQPSVSHTFGSVDIYCFKKPANDSVERSGLDDCSFIGKIWCYEHKRLYVRRFFYGNVGVDVDLQLLFPARIRKNTDYKDRNGDYWKSYEYIGKESVAFNGTVYANCLKIDLFETFGSSKRIGSIWLAKNVGLVKWEVKEEKVPFRYLLPVK